MAYWSDIIVAMSWTNLVPMHTYTNNTSHKIDVVTIVAKLLVHTVYGKAFEGENFCGFRGYSLNHKSFPTNHGLIPWVMALSIGNISLQACCHESFQQITVFHSKKVFPLECFVIYGMCFLGTSYMALL